MKFEFENYRKLGFAGVGISGKNINEISANSYPEARAGDKGKNKLPVLTSNNADVLKTAARSREFRVLHQPNFTPDVGLMRLMAQNKKIFEIPANALILSNGLERAIIISKMRTFIKFCLKFRVDFALSSRATNEFEVKTPGELVAIGEALGLSRDQAIRAVSVVPESVIARKIK